MPRITGIKQLATCPPQGGQDNIGLIENATIVWHHDTIVWAGPESRLPPPFKDESPVDCQDGLVVPGLVDCHTHLCFGGWRGDEFAERIAGKTYLEIAREGGGIVSTVRATRAATAKELVEKASCALDEMLKLGITTVECKSGYGLDRENELKQLGVYQQLDQTHDIDLAITFLGAHVIPPEYSEKRDEYIELLCKDIIPAVAEKRLAEFCDCYIDAGAYTLAEGRRILSCAREHGLKLKVHAEQLEYTGAAGLAAELGAISAEHLEHVDDEAIAAMARAGVIAVSLPLASMYLGESYTPARKLIEAGVPVAVATDFNPGSSPVYHLPLAMTLACLNQQMTPSEALKGATTHAAAAIGREKRIGSLLPGYQADIAIIDAPSVNHWLYHFRPNACKHVVKRGRLVQYAG